ncbi:MAG: YcaO-like family protein [Desulfotalea sp.]
MIKKTVVLKDCFKTFTEDQDKAITPEQTLERFYERVKALDINIVSEVKRIDNGRLDIPVFFSVCGDDASKYTGTKKQMGKGASPIQSEASACMELAERFSFFSFTKNDDNFLVGDYAQMREAGYPVLELSYLLKSVHDEKTSEDELDALLDGIPMQWTWATRMTGEGEVLIPFSWFFAINEFNGPSAGNTLEEAALQGVCEIVERDVCSRVNRDKIVTPKIDPSTVKDLVAIELLEKFSNNNIELYLNDFSLDTGIATVSALAIDRSTFPEKSEIVYTAGTTPNAEKALIRAITEVAQLAGDFNSHANYVASGLPKPLSMDEVTYLTESPITVGISDMVDGSDDNIYKEVKNCLGSLKGNGFDVFMIDVTHPQLQISALYTIVPGAHFRERSMICDAGLFSAKLLVELVPEGQFLNTKLEAMNKMLPNAYYLHFYKAKSLYNNGMHTEALVSFDSALSNNPEAEDLPYIYSFKGCCLRDLGQYKEAIETLNSGLEHDEERPDIHNTLGVCHFKLEQHEKAIVHFTRAVELNPVSAIDYANLGVNYQLLNQKEDAIKSFTVALSLDDSLDFAKDALTKLTK